MNNKFLLCAMVVFCAFSLQVNAQLEVLSSGNVKMSKNLAIGTQTSSDIGLNLEFTGSASYGIKALVTAPAENLDYLYGVYGKVDASLGTHQYVGMYDYLFGVYGTVTKGLLSAQLFSAGVAGITPMTRSGVGVYGGIGTAFPSNFGATERYAGYFKGTTNVQGTLIATATSFPSSLTMINPDSRGLPTGLANKLNALQPIAYTLNQEKICQEDEEATEMQGVHYGLVAEDVQKVFPELVYQRGEQLSVNYVELIPLLLQQIQTLSAEVEELKKQVK